MKGDGTDWLLVVVVVLRQSIQSMQQARPLLVDIATRHTDTHSVVSQ